MGKILKWFPLNKKMEKGNIKSLLKTLLKYIGVWLIGGIIAVLLSGIPLINSFAENVFSLYGWYMRIGLVLACIQCFFYETSSTQEYYQWKTLMADFQNCTFQWKYPILIGAIVLCMIPYSSIGRMLMRSQIEAEMNEEDEEEEQEEKEEDRDKNKEHSC